MIAGYQNFTYIGYTLGGNLPTLYFLEGRYTQVHGNPANIGWHPARVHHVAANISNAEHARYSAMRKANDVAGLTQFKDDFRAGLFRSNAADAKYFECSSDDGITWLGHPSRAKFIAVGDPGFIQIYNEAYAKGVLANGVLAPNGH